MAEPRLDGVRRALVIGLGRSGVAAVNALTSRGIEVVATERQPDADGIARARAAGADVRPATDPAPIVPTVDVVVPSPGVAEHAPAIERALGEGVPVWSEPELGWRLVARDVVGITGTNGKTSVTELTAGMLSAGGVRAETCGNIGRPFTEVALASEPGTTLVAELSSFQLRFTHTLRPRIGTLLNLAEDHADWHGDAAAYADAKARLWRSQTAEDWAVINRDDPRARGLADRAPGRLAWFGHAGVTDGPGVVLTGDAMIATAPDGAVVEIALRELTSTAPHHVSNVAAATLTALLAGAGADGIVETARAFRPGRHRIETVVERDGVRWVDDSKATNPHAAAAALEAFDRILWIAGGLAKGVDLKVLGDHLGAVRHAFLIGSAADELASVCELGGVQATHHTTLEGAVRAAATMAQPGDTVLLAPACASFDMFRDYAERGDRFAASAREVTDPRQTPEAVDG
ncbi:MAG: UDP-N-acetylmuramoyl-L-alanine--D-glutamate ligase [Actinobacteria bacterium]|nr:UDP-N-acetylmuramoyl-L-alanine--D-glutamate ligase [Actinomycetota bacterium]